MSTLRASGAAGAEGGAINGGDYHDPATSPVGGHNQPREILRPSARLRRHDAARPRNSAGGRDRLHRRDPAFPHAHRRQEGGADPALAPPSGGACANCRSNSARSAKTTASTWVVGLYRPCSLGTSHRRVEKRVTARRGRDDGRLIALPEGPCSPSLAVCVLAWLRVASPSPSCAHGGGAGDCPFPRSPARPEMGRPDACCGRPVLLASFAFHSGIVVPFPCPRISGRTAVAPLSSVAETLTPPRPPSSSSPGC
jgi:hypothetical protein